MNQFQSVLHQRAAHHIDPEVLLRVYILHDQVHVSHRDAELIPLSELGMRWRGTQYADGEEGEELHKGDSIARW